MNDWIWSKCTKETLIELVNSGKSTKQIAELYNMSYWSVYKKLKNWNIDIPKYYIPYNKKRDEIDKIKVKIKIPPKITKEKLEEFTNLGYTVKMIANILNMNISYLYKKYKEYGISYNKAITKKEIPSYICPECNKVFHISSWYPLCNNCGNKHNLILVAEPSRTKTDLGKHILKLRKQNLSYSQICKKLNCSKSIVSYYCNQKTKNKSIKQHKQWKSTWVGRLILKLDNFKRSRRNFNKVQMCLDWNKKFRTRVSEFCNRYKNKGNLVKKCNYKEVLEYLKGTKVNCYLTGTPIDLEKDDYCFDHIVPVSKGGTNDLSNLGITIPIANYSKSNLTLEEYLELCKKVLEHHGYTVNKI